VARVIDTFLRGMPLAPEIRLRSADGGIEIRPSPAPAEPARSPWEESPPIVPRRQRRKTLRIFPYAVDRGRLERAIRTCQVPAHIVNNLDEANVMLTLKSQEKHRPKRLHEAQARGVLLHVLRNNTVTQMVNFLQDTFGTEGRRVEEDDTVLQVTEAAIQEVMEQARPVELAPQNNYVRRLQHRLAERYGLVSHSRGTEPYRRVIIYPK
jgi:hypothetical protein